MAEKLLEIKNLHVLYKTDEDDVYALNGVDLDLEKGETLGLVGETGAGKSTIALSIMKLLPDRTGFITEGEIRFDGKDLVHIKEEEMRSMRGNDISMIEAAGIGIAMYNASDDVKAAATMVTALDNNHDGLARELLDLV